MNTARPVPDAAGVRAGAATLRALVEPRLAGVLPAEAAHFLARLERYGPDVIELLRPLYGHRPDFEAWVEAILATAADAFLARPAELKALDARREADPTWYQHHTMIGAVCYVDRFAGTLEGIRQRIPYFRELGLTYLHLMPLFRTPDGPNDGGYAVSSYREVNPALGTMDDLRRLAADLRASGISLALDFVFNHTANDHAWARKARAGDPRYQAHYYMFPDRTTPDAYEATLREIFPEEDPGSFTFVEDVGQWVWTTFHRYQWDLNYSNPEVFQRMLGELLFLANIGAEVLRLDAVAFIWKRLGTNCENLPEAHRIIQAFNALVRIAAPALVFKSEAIVHPDEVVRYFGTGEWAGRECELSYNPLLMVELWEALATRHTHLLTYSMQRRFAIPPNCAWVNYVRSHDDIGWGFADEDAEALHIHAFHHRQYLNRFYTGQEPGSFAAGHGFQWNPRTLDMRISGTTASLAGLEKALAAGDEQAVEYAIGRILLMFGIVLSMGGIPLLYLGDEVGTLNDYSYRDDPQRARDSRWMHRPRADEAQLARRNQPGTVEHRIFNALRRMIALRKQQPAFGAAAHTGVIETGNPHSFVFVKSSADSRVLVAANFTEREQHVATGGFGDILSLNPSTDLLSERAVDLSQDLTLPPYGLLWIAVPPQASGAAA